MRHFFGGILVITLMGFYTRMGSAKSANLALLGGLLIWPHSKYVLNLEAPYIISVLVSALLFLTGMWGASKTASKGESG